RSEMPERASQRSSLLADRRLGGVLVLGRPLAVVADLVLEGPVGPLLGIPRHYDAGVLSLRYLSNPPASSWARSCWPRSFRTRTSSPSRASVKVSDPASSSSRTFGRRHSCPIAAFPYTSSSIRIGTIPLLIRLRRWI